MVVFALTTVSVLGQSLNSLHILCLLQECLEFLIQIRNFVLTEVEFYLG